MKFEVRLPDLGDDAEQQVTVSAWMAETGAALSEGDDLLEITTDKAAFLKKAFFRLRPEIEAADIWSLSEAMKEICSTVDVEEWEAEYQAILKEAAGTNENDA